MVLVVAPVFPHENPVKYIFTPDPAAAINDVFVAVVIAEEVPDTAFSLFAKGVTIWRPTRSVAILTT